jgi:hypothetical protein
MVQDSTETSEDEAPPEPPPPAEEPLDRDDGEDGDENSGDTDRRVSVAAAFARLHGALIPAATVTAVVLLLAWTVMFWQMRALVTAIDGTVQALRLELETQRGAAPPGIADAGHDMAPPSEVTAPDSPDDEHGASSGTVDEPEAIPEVPATLLGRPVYTGVTDVWNCTDFEDWAQAQIVYNANLPLDPNILDFDANGIPCESLLHVE